MDWKEIADGHRSASEIIGRCNFFGIEQAVTNLKVSPSKRELASLTQIPWKNEELERCAGTHLLVAVFPLSIVEIRDKVERNLFRSHENACYNAEAFAKDKGETSWQLISKVPVFCSASKTWAVQKALLSDDEETPEARVTVYVTIGHYLSTGERLLERMYVRCSDVDSSGCHPEVGGFTEEGLIVDCQDLVDGSDDVGMLSAKK